MDANRARGGSARIAYTDANGNFFFREGGATTALPAIAGVRSAASASSMVNKISEGSCNACHGRGSRLTF